MKQPVNLFRPCIDLHQGKVRQIVGSSLKLDSQKESAAINFSSNQPAEYFAQLYLDQQLYGGHIILLDGEVNREQAIRAIKQFPDGFHIGGGLNLDRGKEWLEQGAEKVIFTSYLFDEGVLSKKKITELSNQLGVNRLVFDLSCYRQKDNYFIAIKGWQHITSFVLTPENLNFLAQYCSEFLIHAIDLEGKQRGIDRKLIDLLKSSPIPTVYAGGISSMDDIDYIVRSNESSKQPIGFTVGSALDLFGGNLSFKEVVERGKI